MTNIIDLTKRVRDFRDTYRGIDELGACDLLDETAHALHTLGVDLYKAEGQRDDLARQLQSAQGCISDWVKFGAEVTEALGLKVMSPKDIKATIARLIEDRARFPDRPDDIGRMIGSRFSNLKAAADENEKRCLRAMDAARAAETDAARYRLLRRGQHWSVVNGIGDDLRAESLDAAVDAVLSADSVQSPAVADGEPVGHYAGEHRDGADLVNLQRDIPKGTPLYTRPAQPLPQAQVIRMLLELNAAAKADSPSEMFAIIVRAVEQAHGIGEAQPPVQGSEP